MKKIIWIIISIFYLSITNTYSNNIEYNTESNIQKAILIEDYVIKHKERINKIIENYEIKWNSSLNDDLEILNESINELRKAENINIEKEKAENIMKNVLEKIKKVNDSLKEKLKIEKEKYEKRILLKKQAYAELWKKIAYKINNINLMIAKKITNKDEDLTSNELKLKNNLINLNRENQKLMNFWNLEFNSEKEIKETFIQILRNIKTEVILMKKTINW